MKKILIASHGSLAAGVLSSIELLTGSTAGITTIDAYVDGVDFDAELKSFAVSLKSEDQVFVFTDLYGGSVNQKVTKLMLERKIHSTVITGFNLPVILEIALASETLTEAEVTAIVDQSRAELKATVLSETALAGTEDDFFQ